MPRTSSTRSFHAAAVEARASPVTAALVWSVTWSAPPDSDHASQRVDRAEAQVAVAGALDVVEQPGDLGGRLVRGERQVVLGLGRDALADRAQVLPAERRPDRLARRPVPHDRARPLVGDADGRRSARRPRPIASCGGVERRARPCRRRRTRRARGTASTAGTAGAPIATICRSLVDDRRPHARRADVEDEDRRHRPPLPWQARPAAAQASDRAGRRAARRASTTVRLNTTPNQRTSRPRTRRIDDEHGLGGEVRADGGDEAVAERRARRAAPTPRTRRRGRTRRRRRG